MKIICVKNGHEFTRDPLDLDFIAIDVVEDFLKEIEHLETNPRAKVLLDFSETKHPKYELVNCNLSFQQKFAELLPYTKRTA